MKYALEAGPAMTPKWAHAFMARAEAAGHPGFASGGTASTDPEDYIPPPPKDPPPKSPACLAAGGRLPKQPPPPIPLASAPRPPSPRAFLEPLGPEAGPNSPTVPKPPLVLPMPKFSFPYRDVRLSMQGRSGIESLTLSSSASPPPKAKDRATSSRNKMPKGTPPKP